MPVPNTFANATATIPLSQLDANFATTITLGNTAIQLGNTVSTLNNMTLANVTVTSGNVTLTNVTVTTANVTTANIATEIVTTSQTLNYGTANGVVYLNGSKVSTTGTALTYDGTTFTSGAHTVSTGVLTVPAGSNTAPSITFSGDTNTGIFSPAADTIAFTEGGVESMRVDASGRLGIGTTSPQDMLVVSNAGNAGWEVGAATNVTVQTYNRSSAAYVDYKDNCLNRIFATNGTTERARIDSSGILLVGTTDIAANSGIGVKARPTGAVFAVGSSTLSDTYNYFNTTAGAYRFYVTNAGVINATSTTITQISDQRLKENIQDIDVGLEKIMALKPRKFDWKEGKGKNIKGDRGWIAQEFEQVFPDMIGTWKDEPPEGEEPYKSVGADLIPILVKAMQEQQQMIETLQAKVAALEGKK